MGTKNYKRLTYSERVKIEAYLESKLTKTEISKKLNRARSTIVNEINFWVNGPHRKYCAELSHELAKIENAYKQNKSKLVKNNALKKQVYIGLLSGLSPELISGRLKAEYAEDPTMRISYESIYRFIYLHPQGKINKKLIKLLVRQKPRRYKPKKRKSHDLKIQEGISIEQRPQSVDDRKEIGNWEGDLLIGAKHSSSIGSLVERKTRYTILIHLINRKAVTVREAFVYAFLCMPEIFRKTMTYDNGVEMADHKELSKQAGISIYFAHPYSAWERGTNENTNGLVRRTYPKKTNFNEVSETDLKKLQDSLNNRPRKVLGYYTPNEILQYELRKNRDYYNYDMELETRNKFPKNLLSFIMPFVDEK